KRLTLDGVNRASVHKSVRNNLIAQAIAQPVRHCVVNGDIALEMHSPRRRSEIRHAPGKCGCDCKPSGICVIFHVVFRSMRQYNRRSDMANHCRHLPKQSKFVQNLEIVANRRMPCRTEGARCLSSFPQPDSPGASRTVLNTAAIPRRKVEVMRVPTRA